MLWRVPLFALEYDEREEAAVLEVLRSRWLTMGAQTEAFESAFARYLGRGFVLATASGTASLHMAVRACGLGPGDEVIVPDLTFVATANAVLYEGAQPVFADVSGEYRLTIDPGDIERKVTPRMKAVIVVHYAGYPCDMDAILAIARKHGLAVIEDCAHAPGASYKGRALGTIGDFGCFSFFSNKNLSTGEGGAIWCPDESDAARLRRIRSHGMTAQTLDRHRGHAWGYDVLERGYNYRLTEIEAALARVQLEKLDANNACRRRIVGHYERLLGAVPGLTVPFLGFTEEVEPDAEPAYHLMVVLLPAGVDRTDVQSKLKQRGIQTSVHYRPLHTFTSSELASAPAQGLRVVDAIGPRLLTLPLWPGMTESEVEYVSEALLDALP